MLHILQDFMRNWDTVQICHLTIDSFSDELLETDNVSYTIFSIKIILNALISLSLFALNFLLNFFKNHKSI